MEKNKLVFIQNMLMKEMERLDNESIMAVNGRDEIYRSNALSQSACTFIKAVNTNIQIMKIADKTNKTVNAVSDALGLNDNN